MKSKDLVSTILTKKSVVRRLCVKIAKGLYLRPTKKELLALKKRINKALKEV